MLTKNARISTQEMAQKTYNPPLKAEIYVSMQAYVRAATAAPDRVGTLDRARCLTIYTIEPISINNRHTTSTKVVPIPPGTRKRGSKIYEYAVYKL